MKELSNNKVMVFGDSVSKGVVYDGRELSVLDNGVVEEGYRPLPCRIQKLLGLRSDA